MYRFFDYECKVCKNIKELMVCLDDDSQICLICGFPLEKQMPAPKGYVRGSNTPVHQ